MEKNHIIALIPDYLDNLLDTVQKEEFESHIKNCASCTQELKEYKALFKAFENEEQLEPSPNVQLKFLEQLELEKQGETQVVSIDRAHVKSKNTWTNDLLKIAASVVLLFGAYFFGKQQQSQDNKAEIAQLTNEKMVFKQTAMLSLLENKSASRRIQGVNYVEDLKQPDAPIVKALTDRMLLDENTNVRAAAVEVLAKYTSSETVKDAFIEALKTEKDPGIQIMIIQTLGDIQEKKAATPMRELLKNEETQPFVKEQIESILTTII